MNHGQPRVSIVMPAYNAGQYIGATISSVLGQTETDWELIVIDDCSTDGTRDEVSALAESESRIRLIALEKNFGGPAGPRNVGVRSARADLVAFLDSDDIWHPDKLKIQLAAVEDVSNAFVCSGMVDFADESTLRFEPIGCVKRDRITYWRQSVRAQIPTSSVLVSRALLLKTPFWEDPAYKAVEDYHCWLRILQLVDHCEKLKAPLLCYRKSEGQISGSKLMMMKKVLRVHREFPGRSLLTAYVYTLTHVLGGFYFRFLKKGM